MSDIDPATRMDQELLRPAARSASPGHRSRHGAHRGLGERDRPGSPRERAERLQTSKDAQGRDRGFARAGSGSPIRNKQPKPESQQQHDSMRIENELDVNAKLRSSPGSLLPNGHDSDSFDYTITIFTVGRDERGNPVFAVKKKSPDHTVPKPTRRADKPKPGATADRTTILRSVLPAELQPGRDDIIFLPDDTLPFPVQPPAEPPSKIADEPQPAESLDMSFRVSNIASIQSSYADKKSEALAKLEKKVDRMHKYLNKMLKLLADSDAGFGDRFVEGLKPPREDWDAQQTEAKVQTLFVLFEKLAVLLRFNELLRMFKEKVYRKLAAICKRYFKIFGTYKLHCTLEADLFLDLHRDAFAAEVQAFSEEVKLFGFTRLREEEEERARREQEEFDFNEEPRQGVGFKIKLDERSKSKHQETAFLSDTDRQKQRVEERIHSLEAEYKAQVESLTSHAHNQLVAAFAGFWTRDGFQDSAEPELEQEEHFSNVYEANYTHQANRIIFWWRHKLKKLHSKDVGDVAIVLSLDSKAAVRDRSASSTAADWAFEEEHSPSPSEVERVQKALQSAIENIPRGSPCFEQSQPLEIKSLSNFFIDDIFRVSLPLKMLPFFFNHLTEEQLRNPAALFREPLVSLADCDLSLVVQGYIFRTTHNLSGFEELKTRLSTLNSKAVKITIPELELIDADSAIKLIIQARVYLRLNPRVYQPLLDALGTVCPDGAVLTGRFRNCLSHRSKKEFVAGGADLEEKRVAFIQSAELLGPRERKAKADEISKTEKMRQHLSGFTMIEELGMAIKSYTSPVDSGLLELRLDFKFPTGSLDNLELEVEGLKIILPASDK